MNTLILAPTIGEAPVTLADSARVVRDELLHKAALVTTISDRIDYDDAMGVLKTINAYCGEIEKQREAAKAPALDVGRKIDALAKELAQKAKMEADRIARVCGGYEAEERRKAEQARVEAEYQAHVLAVEARKAEQAARKAASTQLDADRAADAIVEKAQVAIATVKAEAVAAAVPKTDGAKLRGTVSFEVIDIKALYAEHPELCTVEPNGTAIRAILKQNPNLQVAGLRHWVEHKVSV